MSRMFKNPFVKMSKAERAAYDAEMEAYNAEQAKRQKTRDPNEPKPKDSAFAKVADALRTNEARALSDTESLWLRHANRQLAEVYLSGDADKTRQAADKCPEFLIFEERHNKAIATKSAAVVKPATATGGKKPSPAPVPSQKSAGPRRIAHADFLKLSHVERNEFIRSGGKINF